MKKLIIHIGNLKTATTTLQDNVFYELYKSGKIEYLNHTNDKTQNFGSYYCKNIIQYITGQSNNINNVAFKNELNNLKKIDNEITLLSNENISLYYNNMSWSQLNSSAIINSKKIKELFQPIFDEIKIIYSIRTQETLIPSFYTQCFAQITGENPKYKDFKFWINVIIWVIFSLPVLTSPNGRSSSAWPTPSSSISNSRLLFLTVSMRG